MASSTRAAALRPAPSLTPAAAALMLALLLGLQPVTTDLYAPGLPSLAGGLGAPMSTVQLTMSALILSFGLSQLVWGPVADRVGRRPVLVAGLLLFTLASAMAMLAGSVVQVVAWRVVQGAGMSAAVMCARAMVRDLYEPHEGARVMSHALTGLGVIAILAPLAGGAVAAVAGWRGTLAAIGLAGAALLAFVFWRVPETARQLDPHATRPGPLAAQMARTLRHPTFLAWALLVTCTYAGLFVYLAGASFAFMGVLGVPAWQFGLLMASCSVAYILGTMLCRRWLPRHGLAGSAVRAGGITLAAGALMAALSAAGVQTVWALLVPQWIYCFGHGVHQPCGQAGAVAAFPRSAGLASALAGFLLATVAFAVGLWLGQAIDGSTRFLAWGVAFWATATCLVAWTLVHRHGEPLRAA